MNELGIAFIWLAARVTVLGAVVLIGSLLVRRSGRPTGSPTGFGLLLIVLLTVSVVSPWPHWQWPLAADGFTGQSADTQPALSTTEAAAGTAAADPQPSIELGSPLEAALSGFLEGLNGELVSPATPEPAAASSSLRWTGWVAIAGLVMLGLGSLRLFVGWAAVRLCVRRAHRLDDPRLHDLISQLQTELGSRRQVRVYESRELTSAATFGWFRPVILLPADWHRWSAAERRMILAHELAHVAAGDAANWMIAQLGLAFHWYHPLVHWLVRSLRLEQELAADARAARLSGGPQAYLLTLAEFAVRQPDCTLAWPARAFLPVRGTFLRRIEMLRNSRISSTRSSPWRRRIVIAASLVTTIFVAGVRRPAGEVVAAAEPGAVPTATAVTAANQDADLQLQNIPQNATAVVVLRPSDLAGREELQPLVQLVKENINQQNSGITLEDISQLLVAGVDDPGRNPPLMEIRTAAPHDFAKLIELTLGSTTEQSVDGLTLHSPSDLAQFQNARAARVVDDRTLILGPASQIRNLIRQQQSGSDGPAWVSRLAELNKSQAAFAVNVNMLRPMLQDEFMRRPNPFLGMVAPLWQNSEFVVGGLQLDQELSLTLVSHNLDEQATEKVVQTVKMLLPVATGLLQGAKASAHDIPEEMRPSVLQGIEVALESLQTATVKSSGQDVTMQLSTDGLAVATMAGLLLPAIQSARQSARRAQAMNNVKQIMLALHNYHDAHGSFPPAVLLGPDGKTKYSWRVAILPYVDQAQLYEQYNRNEPWDSPGNREVLKRMPDAYRHPSEPVGTVNASYFAFTGSQTAFGNTAGEGLHIREFTDGTSNTLMVV